MLVQVLHRDQTILLELPQMPTILEQLDQLSRWCNCITANVWNVIICVTLWLLPIWLYNSSSFPSKWNLSLFPENSSKRQFIANKHTFFPFLTIRLLLSRTCWVDLVNFMGFMRICQCKTVSKYCETPELGKSDWQTSSGFARLLGRYPQICTVLNFGMTNFYFDFLLLFLANLTRHWVIFGEKMERQA